MENKSFSTSIEISTSPEEVFNAIKDITKWWSSEDFEGSSSKLGDEFIIHHPNQHHSVQRVIEVVPNKKIVWLVTGSTLYWLQKDQQEWTNTKMTFDISPKDKKTILQFSHEGLVPEKECYAMCEKGWTKVIKDWLFYYLTTGTSSPEMTKAAAIREQSLREKKLEENKNS
ncbi:MAG: SRPBCC domain-containing protein [Bacteroidetes bacterium]|nr:SRPBCC domain-containing protein [Bacteroidota bacterium]